MCAMRGAAPAPPVTEYRKTTMPVIESVLSPAPVLVVPRGAWLAALGIATNWRPSRLLREARGTRYVSLLEGRRHSPVVDDELINDSHPFEQRLRLRYQRPHLASVDGGGTDDFGDQLAA